MSICILMQAVVFNKYNVRARLPRWLKPPGTVMMKLRACGVFVVIESDFT